MKALSCLLLLIFNNLVSAANIPELEYVNNNKEDFENLGDFDINTSVKKYGYPLEEHTVETEDGYMLVLHRIPYGKTNTGKDNRPPVLLTHCTFGTSGVFVMLGPNISLAFQLAEAGYDVWLGNNRGNTYSHEHKTLDPKNNASYWDFSFHELGYYDLPAMIDFVLNSTSRTQLSYIGYSQGSTQFFVMASTRPEYNEKVNIMTALGPIAYLEHMSHPLVRILRKFAFVFEGILTKNNITELLGHNPVTSSLISLLCRSPKFQETCAAVTFMLGGFDSEEFDRSEISDIVYVLPGGGSLKEVEHYLQLIQTKYFRQFDYGIIKNWRIYNDITPPSYNISLITVPVALFYSENDLFGTVRDVERLAQELRNVERHLLNYKLFTHLDFIIAKDLSYLLHFDLINSINIANGLTTRTSTSSITTTTTSTTSTRSPTSLPSSSIPTDSPGSGNMIKYSPLTILVSFIIFVGFIA